MSASHHSLRRWIGLGFSVWLGGCATTEFSAADVDFFQPEIITSQAPERPLNAFGLTNNTLVAGLAPMRALVPAYKGTGLLLASWNPHPHGIAGRPTLVIVHGGHGLNPTDFSTAVWARRDLDTNVLVLDSFWSRGREENWLTWTRFGANMRVLDVIAAGRWLQDQGVDKDSIFLMGGSQGGWTVLRTFTRNAFIEQGAKDLYRGGISLYPNCNSRGTRDDPSLGPYWGSVIVFTGGQDTATPPHACPRSVFTAATQWTHYPEATHGWDISNRGAHSPSVDGECSAAANVYNRFRICRSDSTTADMQAKIQQFVRSLAPHK